MAQLGKDDSAFVVRLQRLALAGVALAAALGLWMALRGNSNDSGLKRYGRLPAFELIGSDGKPFTSERLRGKVWVASFVFTQCKNSCPILAAQLKRLARSLPEGPDFALVSFSVDPVRDTPQVLRRYAQELGLVDARWFFVTGSVPALKRLIQDGFLLSAEPGELALDERGRPDILHSNKIVLVDRAFGIRGYYDGLLGSSVEAVRRDALRLAKETVKDRP
jgi:protein SCO1/2